MDLGGVGVGRGVAGGGVGGGGGSGDEGVATAEAAVWWGPKAAVVAAAAASASADVMNQLCRVCGEPAAGFHFGAFTCEGCKSFFGRTYSNLSSISECKNNGECVINKKNRTSCKACRLRKCLLVGMSKSGSRYGRRSNWFKIHCLLQEQQQQQQQQQQQVASSISGGTGTTHTGTKANPNQLWSTKSMSGGESPKGFHLEQKSLAASPSPTRAPPVSLPQPLSVAGFPADAAAAASAAAFWAQARGSLLQLPSPHLSALPMPFLTPPFLHGASFNPYQHKGFLLPFLPPATGPGSVSPVATLSLRPSRPTSPASRTVPSASFSDGKRSPSSSERESPPPSPPTPPATAPSAPVSLPGAIRQPPPAAPTTLAPAPSTTAVAAAATAAATALAVNTLRALGPMQDHPLDLSVKGMTAMEGSTRTSSNDCVMTEGSEELSEEDVDRESQDEDVFSEELMGAEDVNVDGQKGSDALGGTSSVKRTTPLDLTTHA